VFSGRENDYWWNRWLKPGFEHVAAWREYRYGPRPYDVMWLKVDAFAALTLAEIVFEPEPPWVKDQSMTVVHTRVARYAHKVRETFTIGPFTCVEHVKALLGIRRFWLRTPWQLYKHIRKHGKVMIS
jgi:hypothetical protein